jgi:hypothetical protein
MKHAWGMKNSEKPERIKLLRNLSVDGRAIVKWVEMGQEVYWIHLV